MSRISWRGIRLGAGHTLSVLAVLLAIGLVGLFWGQMSLATQAAQQPLRGGSLAGPQAAQVMLLQSGVALLLAPAESTVQVGQIFTLEIVAQAGDQRVDALAAFVDFDPSYLVVVSEAGWPLNQIQPGTALATIVNSVDNAVGIIDYVAYSGDGGPATGTFVVATIRLKVKEGASGDTWVRFSTGGTRQTDVYYDEESVLGPLQAAHVQLPGVPSTATPTESSTRPPTATATATIVATATSTATLTREATATLTPSATFSVAATATPTATGTGVPTATATDTTWPYPPPLTATPTATETSTATPSPTATYTMTPTRPPTATWTPTSTATATETRVPISYPVYLPLVIRNHPTMPSSPWQPRVIFWR